MKKIAITLFIILIGSMLISSMALAIEKIGDIDICTYSVGSNQFIWEAQHAKLISKYTKYRGTAAFCGAETASIKLLARKNTDFAEVCSLEYEFAKRGTEFYKRLGPEKSKKRYYDKQAQVYHYPYGAVHFFVQDNSSAKTIADLRGMKGSLSSAACTVGPICRMIFEANGLYEFKDYTPVHYSCGSGQAPDALADRTLDFFECNNPGKQPSVMNIYVRNKIRMLPFAPGAMKKFLDRMNKEFGPDEHGLYTTMIPKGLYGKNDTTPTELQYVAFDLITSTYKDQDEDKVYTYCSALFDHLPEFYEIGAYSELITLEGAMQHLHPEVPIHPGAARYFYEKKVLPKKYYKYLPADIKAKLK